MITECDMCGSKIVDNKCDCGSWIDKEEFKDNPINLALQFFHEQKKMFISGDAPHLGCALILFRGDYTDCQEVIDFIQKRKGRPNYNNGN